MTRSEAAGASSNPVSELIKFLAEERETFTSVEIAETLWLAMQLEPAVQEIPDESAPPQFLPPPLSSEPPEAQQEPEPPSPLPHPPTSKVSIATPVSQAGVLPPQTLPVWVADPPMLTDSLALIRALKPLLQKVEASTGKHLDEAATVDNIARTRLCLPILEPEWEPWFDIILAIDRGSSMYIWQRLAKDVARMLRRYGAFRNVQVFDLVVNQSAQSPEALVLLLSHPQQQGHRPSELIDQRGHRIAIVLSDCAGTYWWDGTLLPMLQVWGKIMPTVVWQMLPAWMWKRTALGRGAAVAISNDIPGAANQQLRVRLQGREIPEDADRGLPIPVVTSESRDLAQWSWMVAGDRRQMIPGFLLPPQGGKAPRSKGLEEIAREQVKQAAEGDINSDAAFHQALETIARERVERFLELASPQAQRLMMLLAAAPVITLPVVRLIRDAMLTDAHSPLPVAEVFLSGLLLRLPGQNEDELKHVLQANAERVPTPLASQDQRRLEERRAEWGPWNTHNLVQYDFVLRARDVLLEFLPEIDAIDVINSVSAAVEQRWRQISNQNFRAFLINPDVEAPEGLAAFRSFASITADILESFGGEYASFVQQLRRGSGEDSPSQAPPEADKTFSDIEPFEFTDNQILEDLEPNFPTPPQPHDITLLTGQTQQVAESTQNLESFEFTVATLQRRQDLQQRQPQIPEWMIQRQQQRAYRYIEPLPNGLFIEMLAIPGGCFLIGSPNDEPGRFEREGPQQEIILNQFFMGRYAVTQAQWRAVAVLPPMERELNPNVSSFQGDSLPVEQVTWYDAVEFCQRLSRHTGRPYRLPTEAEWEYACRAGSDTAFHFGAAISTELANYNGARSTAGLEAEALPGMYRAQTVAVDEFNIANSFGLSNMHGNVWEWCQDQWRERYDYTPPETADRDFPESAQSQHRVARGGSWYSTSGKCRAASRFHFRPNASHYDLGFRIVY